VQSERPHKLSEKTRNQRSAARRQGEGCGEYREYREYRER
jgi:hypothetical protein